MSHVAVVGGGITGLVAALDLARAGVRVTVVERASALGGKVRTDAVDGFLVEHGPDSVVAYRPAALRLVEELGLAEEVLGTNEPRAVYLRRSGRMVPMPEGMGLVLPTRLRPFLTTRLLTWPQKARAGVDVLLPRRLGPHDTSVGVLLRARLGPGIVSALADPLLGGVYGASVDELSLDAVLPQLRAAEEQHRSLLLAGLAQGRAARAGARAGAGDGPAPSPFRSLRRGMGSLVEALTATLTASPDVELRTGVAAAGLASGPGRTTLLLDDGARLAVDAVVLAADATTAAALLDGEVPAAAAQVRGVHLGSSTIVSLGYPVEAFAAAPPGHGYLEAGPGPAALRAVTVSSAKWAHRAPEGHVLLRAFLPVHAGSSERLADADVVAVVERAVGRTLHVTGSPVLRHVVRWTSSMPVYTVGHLDRMAALRTAMATRPAWILAGSTYDGVGVPDCVTSGRRAAAGALALLDGGTPAGEGRRATRPSARSRAGGAGP